jgi:hypothetical protein
MITGAQIRAAKFRALLRLTMADPARRSTVRQEIILKAESVNGVPTLGTFDLEAIKTELEDAGIEFVGTVGVKRANDARM